jgi:hypothetical protein
MLVSIRGATVGLMVGMRDSMLMLGERMKPCAWAAGPARQANGNAADSSARAVIRRFAHLWIMGPPAYAADTGTPRGFKASAPRD